jgi:FkbM family methyltransferase
MMINFLQKVQQAGLKIDTVYDIGAFNGSWSRQTKALACPDAEFFLFEANPVYDQVLESTGFSYLCGTALSNPGRETVEFYNGTNTGDSYYKETTKHYDNQGTIQLPCTTIDKAILEFNLPIPQFIKIDTQGSELDILSGAEGILDRVDLIYTECPIVRYNSGAPDFQEYLNFFKKHKFIPIDILEKHHAENTLIQVDIMFMRYDAKQQYLGANDFIRPLID